MIKLNRIVLAGAIMAVAASTASAGVLAPGFLAGGSFTVTANDPNFLAATTFKGNYLQTDGTGSLNGVSGFTAGPVTFDVNNISSFILTVGNFTFAAGNIVSFSSSADGNTRNFMVNGTASLTGPGGTDTNTSSLAIAFLRGSNGSITATTQLFVPAVVPEPSSVAMAGIGLTSALLFGLRKRISK